MITLYDWQQADVDRISPNLTPEAGALVVTAPGGGKTLVATNLLKRATWSTALIIAPPSTHDSWADTLVDQGLTAPRQLIGTKPGKAAFSDLMWDKPGIYITSAQWFCRQDWGNISPGAVIFDEVHQGVTYGTATQKALLGHGKKKGLRSPVRIALSGTPFRNNFENFWALARWIQPDSVAGEYWLWRRTECAGKYSPFASQNFEVTGEREPGKLVSKLVNYVIHYQRERCCDYHPKGFLAHVPKPIEIKRVLQMTPAQASFYRAMSDEMVAMLTSPDENGEIPVIAELPITARGMLRFCALGLPSWDDELGQLYFDEMCESPKIDALLDDLGKLDGKRALVLTHSKRFAKVVARRVAEAGYAAEAWHGDVTQTQRKTIKSDFISGKLDVIVGVISAMGTGTDGLQTAAYNVMWLSIDDDATNNKQGVGRLDRLGQTHGVVSIEYQMRNTLDVGHLDKQLQKMLAHNAALKRKDKK